MLKLKYDFNPLAKFYLFDLFAWKRYTLIHANFSFVVTIEILEKDIVEQPEIRRYTVFPIVRFANSKISSRLTYYQLFIILFADKIIRNRYA